MKPSLIRLAQSISAKPLNLREASATLLPPLPLYRRLLRAHRYLPGDMRSLGDVYIKAGSSLLLPSLPPPVFSPFLSILSPPTQAHPPTLLPPEFRRHQKIDNPAHIIGFLSQWKMYLDELPTGGEEAHKWKGKRLDPTVFEKMSKEQLGQLYELMHATKDVWKPVEENGELVEESLQSS